MTPQRYDSIDATRGIAVTLMIISHGVTSLFPVDALEGWRLVPLHLITKFSSTMFFLIFGFTLGSCILPYLTADNIGRKRRHLIFRGLEILVWYKILTFIQMFQIYDRKTIIDTLLFLRSPDYAEVLGFYGIFLLWFPLIMFRWKTAPPILQFLIIVILAALGTFLTFNFDFWGATGLKAILVEQQGTYTFGQVQRGALVFFGILLGRLSLKSTDDFPLKMVILSLVMFAVFAFVSHENFAGAFRNLALNVGKHPPNLQFMSFSLGGALLTLGIMLLQGREVMGVFKPFTWIGRKPLQAFIFHIFVLFVGFRYLLNLRHTVSYSTALGLACLLVVMTMAWCYILSLKDSK